MRTDRRSHDKWRSLLTYAFVLSLALAIGVRCHADPIYNRLAACHYAEMYWDKVCSDGYYFADREGPTLLEAGARLPSAEEGFDCAHFVSCCIGGEPHRPAGGLDIPTRTAAYGEPGAQRLVNWLLGNGATIVGGILDLSPGDVVAYDADRDGWIEHVALYMGEGLVTAHSISRYSEWNPDPTARIIPIRLPGSYEPPQTPEKIPWVALTIAVAVTGLLLLLGLTRGTPGT